MTERDDQRLALREYYLAVMDETGMSAQAWAEKAKTTPTNITRLTAKDGWEDSSIPRADTLAKIFKAVPGGISIHPPDIFFSGQHLRLTDNEREALAILRAAPEKRVSKAVRVLREFLSQDD